MSRLRVQLGTGSRVLHERSGEWFLQCSGLRFVNETCSSLFLYVLRLAREGSGFTGKSGSESLPRFGVSNG